MSFKKIIISTVVAAAVSTSAFAANGASVNVAAEGTGDYLLFPSYFANGQGWETNLKVVNTNTSASIVAKVVVRESRNSDEKLDFLIYLTPTDVWEGKLYSDGTNVYMTSTDESTVIGGVAASPEAPITLSLSAPIDFKYPNVAENLKTQNREFGYVEVFGASQMTGTVTDKNGNTTNFSQPGVDKVVMYNVYKGVPGYTLGTYSRTYVTSNEDLYGMAVISADNANGKLAMTYKAMALENFTGTASPSFATIAGQDTTLDDMTTWDYAATPTNWAAGLALDTDNAVYQYERAIDRLAYVTHYGSESVMDETVVLATIPTKKYRLAQNTGSEIANMEPIFKLRANTPEEVAAGINAANIATVGVNWSTQYAPHAHDQHETVKVGGEVSGDAPGGTTQKCWTEICYKNAADLTKYGNGWIAFDLTDPDSANRTPFVPLVMTAKKVGGANVTNIVDPQSTPLFK